MVLTTDKLFEEWQDYVNGEYLIYYKDTLDEDEAINFFDTTIEEFCEEQGYSERTMERLYSDTLIMEVKDAWYKALEDDYKFTHEENPTCLTSTN